MQLLSKIVKVLSHSPIPDSVDERELYSQILLLHEKYSFQTNDYEIKVLETGEYYMEVCHVDIYTALIGSTLFMSIRFYDFLMEHNWFDCVLHFFRVYTKERVKLERDEYKETINYLYKLDMEIPGDGLRESEVSEALKRLDDKDEIELSKQIFNLPIFQERCYQRGLEFIAKRRSFSGEFNQSLMEMHTAYTQVQKITKIMYISLGTKLNKDVWNVLSIESLAGDLQGEYKSGVYIQHTRISNNLDIAPCIIAIREFKPDLLGISIEIATEALYFSLITTLAESDINAKIIIGGVLPTYIPEYFIDMPVFKDLRVIGSIGEGELCFRDLVKFVRMEKCLEDIPNIYYYDDSLDKVVFTHKTSVDKQMLIHPPTTYTIKKGRTNILQFSRFCIFRCSYCTQGPYKRWEALPFNRIIKNLCLLVSEGVTELEFVDDEFFGGRSEKYQVRIARIIDVFQQVKAKYSVSFTFRIFTNPFIVYETGNKIKNEQILYLLNNLKKCGLTRVYFGIESGSLNQRKRYNRTETLEECLKSIEIIRSLDIEVDIGFIMFDPEMTLQDIRENVDFFINNNLILSNTWPFRPLTVTLGTPIYYHLKEKGLLKDGFDDNNLISIPFKFQYHDVEMIYQRVLALAKTSDLLFYNLKYITKEHNSGSNYEQRFYLCRDYVIQNAKIYLEYMYELSRDGYNEEIANKAHEHAVNSLISLVEEIEENLPIILLTEEEKNIIVSALEKAKINLSRCRNSVLYR